MGNLLGPNNEIPDGINAKVFRLSAENKNLLSEKNSMYVGTGQKTSQETSQGTEEIVQTGVISPPQNEGQMLRYDARSTNINWQQLSTGDLVQDKALSATTPSAIATALGITDAQLESIVSLLSILSVSGQIITFNSSLYADSYANLSSLFTYTTSNNEVTVTGLTEDGKNYLTQYNGEMIIPSSISGNTVTTIGSSAFSNITNLTSITIPNTVINVNKSAFSGCTGLTEINWNAVSVSDFANDNDVFYKAGTAGDGITVIFGDSVQKIPAYLFDTSSSLYRPNIKSVTIGNSVESIGGSAFHSCSGLTSITIPDSVTSIGSSAFYNCSGLTSITIPDSVTSIGEWAFYGCEGLTSATIGDGVTSVGNYVFRACSNLASVIIGNNVTNIGIQTFLGCTSLTSIIIPDSVTSIGTSAFSGCRGLTSVTIGNSVTSIGHQAFYNCSGLTSITIPDSVTDIGNSAFYDCSGLTSVAIGNGVENIESNAFNGCAGLISIVIPSSVTSMGIYVFENCSSLVSATFTDTTDWQVSISSSFSTYTALASANLANTSTAATYLNSTYIAYYWRKV